MKPLLPLAVLLAVAIAGCSKSEPNSDPNAEYRDAQLTRGMKIADIKQQFGEPDSFDEWWNKDPDDDEHFGSHGDDDDDDDYERESSDRPRPEYPHHVQELNYGAFGAHSQKSGHVTRHRLEMTFVDGKLYTWDKSTPVDGE